MALPIALWTSPHRRPRLHHTSLLASIRRTRGRRPLSAMLNLNPLIGVLVILAIFLLPQFQASGELLCVCRHPPLPQASHVVPLEQGPVIMISSHSVALNGDPKADTSELMEDPKRGVIQPLRADLGVLKDNHRLLHPDAAAFPGVVNIQAEKNTPFKILRRVLATCKAAGYDRPSFVVETFPQYWFMR